MTIIYRWGTFWVQEFDNIHRQSAEFLRPVNPPYFICSKFANFLRPPVSSISFLWRISDICTLFSSISYTRDRIFTISIPWFISVPLCNDPFRGGRTSSLFPFYNFILFWILIIHIYSPSTKPLQRDAISSITISSKIWHFKSSSHVHF